MCLKMLELVYILQAFTCFKLKQSSSCIKKILFMFKSFIKKKKHTLQDFLQDGAHCCVMKSQPPHQSLKISISLHYLLISCCCKQITEKKLPLSDKVLQLVNKYDIKCRCLSDIIAREGCFVVDQQFSLEEEGIAI